MLCQKCGQRPAVVQRSVIRNNEKTEEYLCEECARQVMQIPSSMIWPGDFDKFFAALLNLQPQESPTVLSCPKCGLGYQQFLDSGRFGCADCYDAFADKLVPLFNKLHNASRYHGKVPGRMPQPEVPRKDTLEDLNYQLHLAVAKEEYEKAAQLRDKIKEFKQRKAKREIGERKGKGDKR